MKDEEFTKLLADAFRKNDRNAYIEVSKVLEADMRELQKEVEECDRKIKKDKEKFGKAWSSTPLTISFCVAFLVFMFNQFIANRSQLDYKDSVAYTVITIVCILFVFVSFILMITYQCLNPDPEYKNRYQSKLDKYIILHTFICSQIDLLMYKDMYEAAYKVQDHLKEHDRKGYEAFINAAKELNINFDKYIKQD